MWLGKPTTQNYYNLHARADHPLDDQSDRLIATARNTEIYFKEGVDAQAPSQVLVVTFLWRKKDVRKEQVPGQSPFDLRCVTVANVFKSANIYLDLYQKPYAKRSMTFSDFMDSTGAPRN